MNNTITTREAITLLQEEAFAASGMTYYDVQSFYKREQERIRQFNVDNPGYLRSEEELLARDPSLHYLETDLSKRFVDDVPGLPYQHPYLYTWLQDTVRYCNEKTGRTQKGLSNIILATAPTGLFNAIALPGETESGIILEDGLLNVASHYANELAFLFYEKLEDGRYCELEGDELKQHIEANKETLDYLAEVIWQYIIEGYSTLPGPVGATSEEDFSIRHVLRQDFILFVLEHECFHIDWWHSNGVHGKHPFDKRYEQMWQFYERHLASVLPDNDKLTYDQFERIYYAQQEELLADFAAFQVVMMMGEKQRTFTASVKGALLFFVMAELIQHLLFLLNDPDFVDKLATYDGSVLALTAIAAKESHPYAFLRKASLLNLIRQSHPLYLQSVENESAKMDFIIESVKKLLDEKVATATTPPIPHAKWSALEKFNAL
ncbi:hypothetical protein [Chitinophaga pinensis]|uniref:Uncharacterized protein n=1 Tax=Chitinophaga pinensis (strain ATCC 43595 / DSM 2588 / LMG 13176 / NBRC 15968 / NCIMB 11800 / UQM 2034) TaxID=485918 RepID=A0A979G9V1_CHIPD|nr:hypothetical protein [Chitinophaga pinensis]ACU63476.1 hypothetical protein Cpin_6064 [Chitinophaga pinensis DSM 2588]